MHRSKKKRNIIIFSLVGVLLCMVAGYAAFQTQLKVTGSSTVTSNWDIEITNVTAGTPTGSAENAVAPSYDKLWASMEANLYDKGDAMEYDVTIENKGTLDAKLNDIITNLDNSNNEAVIITFSGYTKGEVLKAKTSKVVHVKIEYNPEYEGGETSSEVEINFDYTQNNNETTPPESTYLLTYDYSTNGGTSVETTEEYFGSGNEVDLSNIATKEGWNFVGWNTDKDAEVGLESYQMPTQNTTLYAIYSKTLKVTYEKGDDIENIGKTEDSCNIYNNGTSCEITLPEITVNDDSSIVGWYNGENKIGSPNDKYTIDKDITLIAQAEGEPYMMARDDNYAFWTEEYRTKIKTIDFLDNKNVPESAVTSWDVSDKQDKSVMAWIINDPDNSGYYKLYIGGTDGVIANEDCSYLFYNFKYTEHINFNNNFDTSKMTDMTQMFRTCGSLKILDLSSFNTSNVTNMNDLFNMWDSEKGGFINSQLTEIKFGDDFNTSNVTTMRSMFAGLTNLRKLDLSNFNTSKVTDMYHMFNGCNSLENLNVDSFDTHNVTNMSAMFGNCRSLKTLDISSFDTSNVTDMASMFSMYDSTLGNINNGNLIELDLSNFDTSNVIYMNDMFSFNKNLSKINLSSFDTSNVIDMYHMFNGCTSLEKLNLCSFDTKKVTNMNGMFAYTNNIKKVYVSNNWITAQANTDDIFDNSNVSEVTQSNNCEVNAEDISLEISTTSTTNSITVIANAKADSGIAKYEYSKDGGKTWEESTSNTYIFTGLTAGTAYDIKVRVTSNIGKVLEQTQSKSTNSLALATFTEKDISNGKTVTITYPSGCGDSLTCTYQKDNGNVVNVTSSTVNVEFTESGSLVANVSDGTNNVSSSYTVTVLPYTPGPATSVITELASTNTNELYTDDHNNIRYYGATPNNYVTFNNELWRIIGVIDGKIKIIRNESLGNMKWNSSSSNNWNNASLKTYLNGEYYDSIESTSKGMISEETYYLGGATSSNYQALTASGYYNAERDSSQVYSGNPASTTQHIGLMYPSDYGYAAGSSCLSTALYSYSSSCKNSDYLFSGVNEWLQAPFASYSVSASSLRSSGYVNANAYVASSNAVRPVLYLSSNVQITGGDGSQGNAFKLG